MTWQELANFINNKMPECNRDEQATIWDANCENGALYLVKSITPYDYYASDSEENFYSIDFDSDANEMI